MLNAPDNESITEPWWADLDTAQRGAIAEAKVRARAAELGLTIAEVVGSRRYDFVVDRDGRLYRVQVKWASRTQTPGTAIANLRAWEGDRRDGAGPRSKGRTYDVSEVDAVIVYVAPTDHLVWLPAELIAGKAAVQIRYEPTRNGQTRGVVAEEEYRW